MRQYETMVIIDAMISDEAIAAEVTAIEDKIKALGGEIVRRDDWGKRKMAYSIKKKSHGYYVIFYYKAEANVSIELEKGFRIDDTVLRWLTLVDHPMTDVVYGADTPLPDAVGDDNDESREVVE